jgi:hypothetical protein
MQLHIVILSEASPSIFLNQMHPRGVEGSMYCREKDVLADGFRKNPMHRSFDSPSPALVLAQDDTSAMVLPAGVHIPCHAITRCHPERSATINFPQPDAIRAESKDLCIAAKRMSWRMASEKSNA